MTITQYDFICIRVYTTVNHYCMFFLFIPMSSLFLIRNIRLVQVSSHTSGNERTICCNICNVVVIALNAVAQFQNLDTMKTSCLLWMCLLVTVVVAVHAGKSPPVITQPSVSYLPVTVVVAVHAGKSPPVITQPSRTTLSYRVSAVNDRPLSEGNVDFVT